MAHRAGQLRFFFVFSVLTLMVGTSAASAQDVAAFYKGKSPRLVIAHGVGGGNDAYSRLLARHIVDHIPGRPGIVVENRPGASLIPASVGRSSEALHRANGS